MIFGTERLCGMFAHSQCLYLIITTILARLSRGVSLINTFHDCLYGKFAKLTVNCKSNDGIKRGEFGGDVTLRYDEDFMGDERSFIGFKYGV